MSRVSSLSRAAVTWLVVTASLLTAGVVSAVEARAADKTYTTTATVHVRSAAATTASVLGQLAKDARVLAAGPVAGDWLPIEYAATTGYVAVDGVTLDKTPSAVVSTGPAGKKTAAAHVNVRATASLDAPIVAVLKKATVVKVTGLTSAGFTQITYEAKTRWIYTEFLSTATDTFPDAVASHTTTTSLALWTTASATAPKLGSLATGTKVGATGSHSDAYTEVIHDGRVGWVVTGYLKAVAGTPAEFVLPLRTATRYVTASSVTMRAAADAESAKITTLSAGAVLRITGVTKDSYTEVIWDGDTKWVPTSYLASTPPTTDLGSASLNKLEPYGKAAVLAVRANFPQIKTIYGWRSSSSYSSDHPNGRAIDNMIPSYKTNRALGDALADYMIANAKRLHITYIIWRQRSYRISRGYWVKMSDRGGDTANHMDHVHVSFEPS